MEDIQHKKLEPTNERSSNYSDVFSGRRFSDFIRFFETPKIVDVLKFLGKF